MLANAIIDPTVYRERVSIVPFFESALGAPQSDRVRLRQRLNRARGQDDLAQCCSLKLVRPEPVEG